MRSPSPNYLTSPTYLFAQSAAGIQISGDSGSGKSNVQDLIIQALIRDGLQPCVVQIDPHGQSARRNRDYCLHRGPSTARRTLFIQPAATRISTTTGKRELAPTVSVNPLAVSEGGDPLLRRQQQASKIEHTSTIFLNAAGDTGGFPGQILQKWMTRTFGVAADLGLSIPDVRPLLVTTDPLHDFFVEAIPDPLARGEFGELASMRPADREALIGSNKNRLLNLLDSPVLEAALGRTDPARVLCAEDCIRQGRIVLIDLDRCGVLGKIHQEILANIFLGEFLYAAFNLPEAERRPLFICLDELPIFARSSGPQLIEMCMQARKFNARLLACHQGTIGFADGPEDRLLNTIMGMCGVNILLRHKNPLDARFFGGLLALPSSSATRVKHELKQQQQYQDGNDLVVLTDASEGESASEEAGGSQTRGRTDTNSWNQDATTTATHTEQSQDSTTATRGQSQEEGSLRRTIQEARAEVHGSGASRSEATAHREGRGGATAENQSASANWSRSQSRNRSRTFKQTLVPRLRWREIVTSVQFFTTEEQIQEAAAKLAGFATGRAAVYVSGHGVVEATFPLAADPFRATPRYAAKLRAAFQAQLWRRLEYATPREILAERQRFLAALLRRLQAGALAEEQEPTPSLPLRETPLLLPRPTSGSLAAQPPAESAKNSPLAI